MNRAVSVIVPVYNRCNFCKTALKYLKNQTLNNIEFIIHITPVQPDTL